MTPNVWIVPVNFNGVVPASERRTWRSVCPTYTTLLPDVKRLGNV